MNKKTETSKTHSVPDVVVAGAGSGSLVAAAYLATAGLNVLVLERNKWVGGGVHTAEVTAPGFRHDLCSTAHLILQGNPVILNDEIGLQSKFGLKYIRPEVTFASVYDDDTALLTYFDLDKTCESMARISARDAETYRRFVEKNRPTIRLMMAGMFQPPAPFGSFMALLEQSKEGRDLIGVLNRSAYDLIGSLFENAKIQNHFMKYAAESMSGPEEKGTGLIFNMICGIVHAFHGGMPVGGSGGLADALVRCIEHHGGTVRTEADVVRVIMEGGRAQGVVLADGEEIRARRAVIGCFHPHLLGRYVSGLDPQLIADAKGTEHGTYSAINTHYALNESPKYRALEGLPPAFIMELLPADQEEFRRSFDEPRYNRLSKHPSMVCITATDFDSTRAPTGKATLYKYAFAPYNLDNRGAARWDEVKEETADWMLAYYRRFTTNMGPENIIARYVESPLDIERNSLSFLRGDISGIGRYLHQLLGRRPIPELGQYAVPGAEGLYLAGPFQHPGGGVNGGGRAVAIRIMKDLGLDFDKTIVR